VTDQKDKPVLDVQTLEKLLEAAYVLQEHNREMQELGESLELQSEQLRQEELATQAVLQKTHRESRQRAPSHGDYTLTLAEIVEAQRQIQMRHLDLDQAMALVAERTAKIANASGAGIGILNGKRIQYRAGCGGTALPAGTELSMEAASCAACFRTGQVIRSENFDPEFLFDPEPIRKRGIESLIAVPIYHDGKIAGALEVYFEKTNGFVEQDIHTCQLMAGLVTEAFARDAELTWKESLASERNTMLEALEKLRPELAVLAQNQNSAPPEAGKNTAPGAVVAIEGSVCRKCGTRLGSDEQFCGKCGSARVTDRKRASLQSTLASAWNAQQANAESSSPAPLNGKSRAPQKTSTFDQRTQRTGFDTNQIADPLELPPLDMVDLGLSSEDELGVSADGEDEIPPFPSAGSQTQKNEIQGTSLIKAQADDITWTSAAKTRDFLEALAMTRTPGGLRRFWNARRGDFYLAIAVVLVAVVFRWGIWSNHSVGASGAGTTIGSASHNKRPAPDADLSAFDKLLISLGLAEAPETPEYKGNPDTQVWEDLHTALYYCPGSDLYGKTPKGKFTSQRDAQLDQFEPAYRKACD
jgi:GAF domain-containing protein/ribosomal protein L40E